MTDDNAQEYRVDRLVSVNGQILELATHAAAIGRQPEFLEILKSIFGGISKEPP